ncbi:MAG: CarD family transcriptional regulator [Thermomicrobiales bacterium]
MIQEDVASACLDAGAAVTASFVEGQHVVYPAHGVGRIGRITRETVAGERLELIHITFDESRMTLRVPVSKAAKSGLRQLASAETFKRAIAVVGGRPKTTRGLWSRKAKDFADKIGSGDPIALAEVARDTRKGGETQQSFSERQLHEQALDRLATELAAIEGIDKATALLRFAPVAMAA